ncbi:MAG: hypothetical protein K2K20_02855, partial [Lachnospiraceae bacterium]|nr:hypothetical protein [Lachnospiraceae bacterium]
MTENICLKMLIILFAGLLMVMVPNLDVHAIGLIEYPDTGDSTDEKNHSEESYDTSDEFRSGDVYGNETDSYAVQSTLYERYNAQYDLYEESLNNLFFFYSNVSNGGFTTLPVSFDVPSNLSYVLEQGGIQIPYTAGQEIKEIGNYVLRISGNYEGIVYQGTFRFTIREEIMEETDETDMEVMSLSDDMIQDSSDGISQERLDAIVEMAGAEMEAQQQSIPTVRSGTAEEVLGMVQDFHLETDAYSYTLKTGTVINANIPNGAIVNGGVSVHLPDSVTAAVFHDGEPYEISGTNFSEEGIYRIVFQENSLAFATSYQSEREYPMLVFRIVNSPIGVMGIYNAPLHTEIIQVAYEGESLYDSVAEGEDEALPLAYYRMDKDGRYCFTMRDKVSGYTYSLELIRDTRTPQFDVSIKNERADTVNYASLPAIVILLLMELCIYILMKKI